eukprot:gene15572-30719_t
MRVALAIFNSANKVLVVDRRQPGAKQPYWVLPEGVLHDKDQKAATSTSSFSSSSSSTAASLIAAVGWLETGGGRSSAAGVAPLAFAAYRCADAAADKSPQ